MLLAFYLLVFCFSHKLLLQPPNHLRSKRAWPCSPAEAIEYLEEQVKFSPIEILAVLSELNLVEVPDEVWGQLLGDE